MRRFGLFGRINNKDVSVLKELRSISLLLIMLPMVSYADDHYVDLGLPSGILWASCNLGASSPEEVGYFYAWGETSPKNYFSYRNYIYKNNPITISDISGTEYDAATATLGEAWRMPTKEELEELAKCCECRETTYKGKVCMKITGPNDNFIYLPKGGFGDEGNGLNYDGYGLWSSTKSIGNTAYRAWEWAWIRTKFSNSSMYQGLPIRPVKNNSEKMFFEIGLFGVRDHHRIGYNIKNFDLSSIKNKFKEQKKSSKLVLNTKVTPELGFSSASSSFLTNKLDSIKNTIDSRTSPNKRFVITAKLDTTSLKQKDNYTQFSGNLSLYIIDIVNKKVFNRYDLNNIYGKGINSENAISASLSHINWKQSEISSFIKKGINNINVHYKNLLSKPLEQIISPFIPLKQIGYEEYTEQFEYIEKCFDNAITFLLCTPEDNECYSKSLDYAAFLAYLKSEYHYRSLLKQASKLAGWSNNQTKNKQNNNKALSLLKQIPKESQFYDEASYYKNEARRNLMTEQERLNTVVKMGEEAHKNMLNKNKREEIVNVQSNTASGIFTLGVLMLASALVAPVSAPASIILIIL
jgi:hypothetical protein